MTFLQLNGIQHFSFCPRQWALITIEQAWAENEDTVIGDLVHRVSDDALFREKRRHLITLRAVPIRSNELRLNGIIDVLELRKNERGMRTSFEEGLWMPNIVEYKKGAPKKNLCDVLQLTAQVMCLEEMHGIHIDSSSLFYKSTNRREIITITADLREKVRLTVSQMHDCYDEGITPNASYGKHCQRCSLVEHCWPDLTKRSRQVHRYIERKWEELQ
ncbi:MAG: CRISPR-associated protein Cas4 [Clostridiaceae bacterium]|nr:CRISPR-associated protein Cas4 [Clostridiaceae bacterium]